MNYGSHSLHIFSIDTIQLKVSAGILYKTDYDPFWIRKADHSELVQVKGFYNIQNIFESILNILMFKFGLKTRTVKLGNDNTLHDLSYILDEITLMVPIIRKSS